MFRLEKKGTPRLKCWFCRTFSLHAPNFGMEDATFHLSIPSFKPSPFVFLLLIFLPSHFWNKCLPTCTSIDAAMVVVGRVIVAMVRTRYRRRRSGTSSTASSRGRIRVRVPVQQVVSLTFPANSIDSNVLTSSPVL